MRKWIIFSAVAVTLGITETKAQAGCRYTPIIQSWYRDYLGREPEPGGLYVWVSNLRRGMPMQHCLAQFLGCNEYWHRNGCNNRGFVVGLYRDFLGRTPCPHDLAYWESKLCRCRDRCHFLENEFLPYAASQPVAPIAPIAPVAPQVVPPAPPPPLPQYNPASPAAPLQVYQPQVRYQPVAVPIYVQQRVVPVYHHRHGHCGNRNSGVRIHFNLGR